MLNLPHILRQRNLFSRGQKRSVTSGKATKEGTQRYAQRFQPMPFQLSPRAELYCSRVGFGAYRIGKDGDRSGKDSLIHALASGINLLDTSSNYADGGSERLIGETLTELVDDGRLKRDEVVIVTKAGYVQGRILEMVKERNSNSMSYPEMEKVFEDADVWHCISPQFLENQITNSLNQLNLQTLDFFLLHNPEHYFDIYQKTGTFDKEFYDRIRRAFEHLETEVKRGRIQHYGVSSNTLAYDRSLPNAVSLEFLLHCAEQVSPTNNFSLIQFPMNLFENEAYTFANNISGSKTVLNLAKSSGLTTLSNRPLNAFVDRKLLFRLAKPMKQDQKRPELPDEVKEALNAAIHHERSYPGTDTDYPLLKEGLPPADQASWAQILAFNAPHLDLFNFLSFRDFQLKPQLDQTVMKLSQFEGLLQWSLEYQLKLKKVLDLFEELLRSNRFQEIESFEHRLVTALPALKKIPNLPQKSIQLMLMSGVDTVLLGMHRNEYVDDAVSMLKQFNPHEHIDEYLLQNLFDFTNDQGKFINSKYQPPNPDQ